MPEPIVTAIPDPNADPTPEPKPETYEITVNGVKKSLTLEELRTEAQKGAAADEKFTEASRLRKDAEDGLKVKELMNDIKNSENPDIEKVREFYQTLGLDSTEVNQIVEELTTVQNEPAPGTPPVMPQMPQQIPTTQLDDRARKAIEAAEQAELSKVRDTIESTTRSGVDKDEVLGKMVSKYPPDQQAKILDSLYKMANTEVRARILGYEQFGPEMVSDTVQVLRSHIQNFGIPAQTTEELPFLGSGPSSRISPNVRAEEPLKRVKSDDPNYVDNAVERVQQMLYKAMRKTPK